MRRDDLISFLECLLTVLRSEKENKDICEDDIKSLIDETDIKQNFYRSIVTKILKDKGFKYPGDRACWELLK